jgi:AraC-like DNA-binding protein
MDSSLSTRIAMYLRQHLGDPDLSPAQVARAHNISVRHLYNLWAGRDVSPGRWIIQERLEAARRELAKPAAQSRTIAAIAHQCGFTDAAHFSRRFRDAYGMSPRDWREVRARNSQS